MKAAESRDVPCRACGAASTRLLGTKQEIDRARALLHIRQCPVCSVVFLADPPDDFDDELYDYYARRIGTPREELFDPLTTTRYRALLARLAERAPGRRLLDVGCGQGQLVETASRSGWDAFGIDLSRSAIEICRNFGISAAVVDVFDAQLRAGDYDVVTMFELIEHVPDPRAFLRRAAELLKPGGLLYLSTPNFAALDRRVLGMAWEPIHSEHIWYFTPRTLRTVFVEATSTLEIESLETRNVSSAALRRLLSAPRHLFRARHGSGYAPASKAEIREMHRSERQLREALEGRATLRLAKAGLNRLLNATGTGNAMTLLASKVRT